MRQDATVKFRQILNKHNINAEFNKAVKDLGIKPNKYLTLVEAIYAFRRIFNFYDDSIYAKAAIEWEDTVVLNRYSRTINNHSDAHSMATVIKVIHALQAEGKWPVPQGLDKLIERKKTINTAINSKTTPTPTPVNGSTSAASTNPVGSSTSATPPTPAPSLHLTTPKPPLPDTKPLSNIPSFDSDDGNYDILDLSGKKPSNKIEVDDYHIFVNCEQGKTYRIRFNRHMSDLMRTTKALHLQIRIDKLIGKTFLVFSATETPGSVLCRWSDKQQSFAIVNSKLLCEYLVKNRTLNDHKLLRHVSQNLSQRSNFLTFELFQD